MLKLNSIHYIIGFLILFSQSILAQNSKLYGAISSDNGKPIEGVTVESGKKGTISDQNGYYLIELQANKDLKLVFSHLSYVNQIHKIKLSTGKDKKLDIQLQTEVNIISDVDVIDEFEREQNITTIDKKNLEVITGPTGGVEGLISTLAGVTTKNELSSQYSVRGGNYDENLVYVNGFEIYRPFLVRSGEQEGLSFINSDMVKNIVFSAGGFEAKYGDKLSSVLDIEYKDPTSWKSHITLSLLGLSATVEGISKSKRWSHITSFRQKTNQFLLKSLDTESDYRPNFKDFQSLNIYHFNSQMKLSFLAHYSSNLYQSIPESRESSFGTIDKPLRLKVYFDGQEVDSYETGMGAVRFDYHIHDSLKMSLSSSIFQTNEQEFYDIEGAYWLGKLDNSLGSDNFGQVVENRGIGAYMNHARNELFAQVYSMQYRAKLYRESNTLEWGVKYQHELIDDRLREWQMIDSSGFSFSAPPSLDSLLELYEFIQSDNEIQSNRISAYVQQKGRFEIDSAKLTYNLGFRSQYWSMNGELFISPRAGISIQPNWEKDFLFKASIGSYNQSPFYREMRNREGLLDTGLTSQKSIHYVLAADYNFMSWGRPFKFVGEIYYKSLKDITPYEIDNLNIRYLPELKANGYTIGVDLRVNGEFVPGVESWASMSLMRSREDIENDGQGYIPRPTDQRLSFSLFFQDYMPKNPSYKMNLKLHYSSGLPFGAPQSERFEQTLRIPSYRRVDIGLSKVIKDGDKGFQWKYLDHFESIWISAEVFNLLGIRNTISYLWVTDVTQAQYAVPNYLTTRLLNFKLQAKF